MIDAGKILVMGLEVIGLNIIPLDSISETVKPNLTYEIENDYQSTKFGIYGNNANAVININTITYREGQEIKEQIQNYYTQNKRFKIENDSIIMNLIGDDSRFNGDSYLTTINYIIYIN